MSAPRTLFNSFIIMFVGVAISLMLMATIGQVGDRTITILADIGMFEVSPDWGESISSVYTFQSFLFFLCALPGIMGIIIFILSAVRRQRYDVQQGPEPQIDIDYTAQFGSGR